MSFLSDKTCNVAGICPSQTNARETLPSGFTNVTGWANSTHCCDICRGASKVNCRNPEDCKGKTGFDDWDYLILDEIWLPQLCKAFSQGHDPTLTHPIGTKCQDHATRLDGLSIHGLWPNYIGGFPSCCHSNTLPLALPKDLHHLAAQSWVDPAFGANDDCSACSMWSHEALKHGSCFAEDPLDYIRVTLDVFHRLQSQRARLDYLLKTSYPQKVRTVDIEEMYPDMKVQVICDLMDNTSATTHVGHFLEIRTCWNRTSAFDAATPKASQLVPIDCGPAMSSDKTGPCPTYIVAASPPQKPDKPDDSGGSSRLDVLEGVIALVILAIGCLVLLYFGFGFRRRNRGRIDSLATMPLQADGATGAEMASTS
eukprot:TRINITY_DN84866_c0_g1_i1.p1 TRINITY_DN84866_c0_g1~~TRINITY_DN84866_c0_g1_i1.p1  ORF type:complete len:369 (+),score=44.46 TRINITY_DN84866_c0_g1_i1:46-1152(+)